MFGQTTISPQFDCVQLYSGLDEVQSLFLCCALLQCASMEAGPSHSVMLKPFQRWATWMGTVITESHIFFKLSSTCQLVLVVVERADHLAQEILKIKKFIEMHDRDTLI